MDFTNLHWTFQEELSKEDLEERKVFLKTVVKELLDDMRDGRELRDYQITKSYKMDRPLALFMIDSLIDEDKLERVYYENNGAKGGDAHFIPYYRIPGLDKYISSHPEPDQEAEKRTLFNWGKKSKYNLQKPTQRKIQK